MNSIPILDCDLKCYLELLPCSEALYLEGQDDEVRPINGIRASKAERKHPTYVTNPPPASSTVVCPNLAQRLYQTRRCWPKLNRACLRDWRGLRSFFPFPREIPGRETVEECNPAWECIQYSYGVTCNIPLFYT